MYHRSIDLSHPVLWTVPGLLPPALCAEYIARIEAADPSPAPITTRLGPQMRPDIRNNDRVVFDDPEAAADLFARVRGHAPERLAGMRLCGANERLRCYRYHPGQRFAAHFDGAFVRDEREQSLVSYIIYLNEGCVGGETVFSTLARTIVPRTGTALLFQHRVLHEGAAVREGVKYVLRSDLMYRVDP
jgi:prolyl 4-hydroxylase